MSNKDKLDQLENQCAYIRQLIEQANNDNQPKTINLTKTK